MLAHISDALRRKRMRPHVRVLVRRREKFLLLQNLKELQQSFRGLPGAVEEAERRLVGRGFLGDRELQEGALREAGAAEDCRRAGAAIATRCGGRGTDDEGDDVLDGGVAQRL